jgi:hypothetical protein
MSVNGTSNSIHFPSHDADLDAVLLVGGDGGGGHLLVARFGHFEMRRQVDPQLEAGDEPAWTAAGHFLVQDAAARTHPLHVAGKDSAFVAEAVAVGGGAFEHVGDGLDAAVRVVGEAADGTFERVVEGEVVEEQEGVEQVADARTEGAQQFDARALDGGLRFDDLGDGSGLVHDVYG